MALFAGHMNNAHIGFGANIKKRIHGQVIQNTVSPRNRNQKQAVHFIQKLNEIQYNILLLLLFNGAQ